MIRPIVLCAALALPGCAAFTDALVKAGQVAQWVGTAVDVAERGAAVYYARHPRPDDEYKVTQAIRIARDALLTYDRAVALGQRIDESKGDALKAYEALRTLLDSLGVLDAKAPEGGAETEAPMPTPIDLPTVEELGATL